jgi:hypothetical protein
MKGVKRLEGERLKSLATNRVGFSHSPESPQMCVLGQVTGAAVERARIPTSVSMRLSQKLRCQNGSQAVTIGRPSWLPFWRWLVQRVLSFPPQTESGTLFTVIERRLSKMGTAFASR